MAPGNRDCIAAERPVTAISGTARYVRMGWLRPLAAGTPSLLHHDVPSFLADILEISEQ